MSDKSALYVVGLLVVVFFCAEGWAYYCRYRRNAWRRRNQQRILPRDWPRYERENEK